MEAQSSVITEHKPHAFDIEITFNGVTKKLTVHLTEQMAVLLDKGVKLFPNVPAAHTMGLFTEANVQLAGRRPDGTDIQQTAEQAGLTPEQLLALRQVVVSGGDRS